MSKIFLSIIIPVFNTEEYLSKCLDSVCSQTLEDIEIICVDDGSSDDSLNILKEYAKKDERIRIISKENEGQGIARNIGIKEARGEYVGFVDSDDFVKKDMFEKLYQHANKNNLDIAMCKVSEFNNVTHEVNDNLWYYSLGVFRDFDKEIFNHEDTSDFTCEISVTPYNKIYKRSLLWDNNIHFAENLIFEDELFFYDVYLKAKRISIVDENLYYYRTNRKGSTVEKSSEKDYSDIIPIFKQIREKIIETGNYDLYKVKVANRFIHLILWRFSETSPKFRKNFYELIKEDFKELLKDQEIYNNLAPNIKSRTLKLINSSNYEAFRKEDKNKIFSIVMACYNVEDYLSEAIESLISQSFGFESNVQVILVDDGSSDRTAEICKEYEERYPENIQYIYQKNNGQASARNLGLKYVRGQYVNFLDSDDKLSADTLTEVYNFFEKHKNEVDVVSVKINFFDRQTGGHPLNYKYKKDAVIDLKKDWDFPQLSASSAFFKRDLFNDYEFDTKIISSEDSVMINKILLDKLSYGVLEKGAYFYRKRNDESSTIDCAQNRKEFYVERLEGYFKELINYSKNKLGYVPKFIQYTLVYDLQWLLRVNEINYILNANEKEEFMKILHEILYELDDDVIRALKNDRVNVKMHMLALKHGNISSKIKGNNAYIYAGNTLIDNLKNHNIFFDIIEIRNDVLFLSGYLMSFFENDLSKIEVIKDGVKYPSKEIHYTNRDKKFLGVSLESPYIFETEIPLEKNKTSIIKINVNYKGINTTELGFKFENHARLSETSSYSIYDDYFIELKGNEFIISKYNYGKMVKSEFKILKDIYSSKKPFYTSALAFRLIYLLLYPFYRNKKIWLFMDRRDSADDNAEHLFKYALNINDGIKKYFTVSEDSSDFKRLSSLKHVLPFYSIKQRLIYLFADKIISSHPDENILNPFWGKNSSLYSGLINSQKIFLQHGVTKDNISHWLHKFDKNLALLVTTSKLEEESFYNYEYNYDEDVIQVLGFPRFDNLKSDKSKKQILIMPSWREILSNANEEQILNSQYFKKINSLINNEKLIEIANKRGYKIIFKPHPLVYDFIDLFDRNKSVIFDENSKYQELFNSSDLLITDYSSVAFDFAYIKKPVIYYQYGNDYNFKEGYFDYETMGFGEVIKTEEDLVNSVEKYLEKDCEIDKKYLRRIESFYTYIDKNNCKRVYEHIKKLK